MRPILTASVFLTLLTGCEVETTETKSAPAVAESEAAAHAGAPAPAPAPAFAPDFPDAQLSGTSTTVKKTSVVVTASTDSGIRTTPKSVTRTHSKTFTTAQSPDAVVAFYKRSAEAGGLGRMRETRSTDGRRELSASGEQHELTVTAAPENGRTTATVSYTAPTG